MRRKIIAGNWKLNKTIKEALSLVTLLKRENISEDGPLVIVCPVFTAISEVFEALGESNIRLGAQNLYWEDSGAFTGEVSGPLLKDAGCEYVIIGHSERRQFFGETDKTVNQRIQAADRNGLIPIVCVGESLKERESNQTEKVLKAQITGAFAGISNDIAEHCIVAYEPVWAIGTGKVATSAQAQEAHAYIRGLLKELYSESLAQNVPILYGGSVKADNAKELITQPDVDGALVGGASLKADSFMGIVRASMEVEV